LSARGVEQAKAAGRCLHQFKLHTFDAVYTSLLDRSTKTYDFISDELLRLKEDDAADNSFKDPQVVQSWRLNERHYGALVGLSKDDAERLMGKEAVMGWRRSWDKRPPPMTKHPFYYSIPAEAGNFKPMFDWQSEIWNKAMTVTRVRGQPPVKVVDRDAVIPLSESLKDCAERVLPLWEECIVPRIIRGENVLVVAHSNTIRGMVKHIDCETLSEENLRGVTIPSAIPLIYSFEVVRDKNHSSKLKPKGKLSPLGVRGRFVVNKEVLLLSLQASQNKEMSENLDHSTSFQDLLRNTLEGLMEKVSVQHCTQLQDELDTEEVAFDEELQGDGPHIMEPGWMAIPVNQDTTQSDRTD
jgi:2,3-bisphosphoglycerate-dependent phosphoglycerate mutase